MTASGFPSHTFKVTLTNPRRRPVLIRADYHKIDNGVLTFRCVSIIPGNYPVFIKSYAAGAWVSVEAAD